MTILYFIRHAEPNYENHDDHSRELIPKGLQDSQHLVNLFKGIPIDHFVSSPYQRAIQTIEPLAKERKLSIELDDRLRERKITDQWIEDFTGFSNRQWEDFSYHLPGGESLQQVQDRNIEALQHLINHYPDQTIVIGTHGTGLSTIVNHYKPDFGLQDFEKIKHLFPYIVKFTFTNQEFHRLDVIPFTNENS